MKKIILALAAGLVMSSPVFAKDYYVDVKQCVIHYGKLNETIYYAWGAHTQEGRQHAKDLITAELKNHGGKPTMRIKEFENKLSQWSEKTMEEILKDIKDANDNATECFNEGPEN